MVLIKSKLKNCTKYGTVHLYKLSVSMLEIIWCTFYEGSCGTNAQSYGGNCFRSTRFRTPFRTCFIFGRSVKGMVILSCKFERKLYLADRWLFVFGWPLIVDERIVINFKAISIFRMWISNFAFWKRMLYCCCTLKKCLK